MLARRDYDAWAAVLSEGLKHEEEAIRPDRALRYLSDFVAKGGDMADLAKRIRKAGELGGVWEPIDDGTAASSARPSRDSRDST
jgi:hypothetical protein